MAPLFCAGFVNAEDKNTDNAEMEQMKKSIEQLQDKVEKLEGKNDSFQTQLTYGQGI